MQSFRVIDNGNISVHFSECFRNILKVSAAVLTGKHLCPEVKAEGFRTVNRYTNIVLHTTLAHNGMPLYLKLMV